MYELKVRREVAKMIGRHSMKAIRPYCEYLNEGTFPLVISFPR